MDIPTCVIFRENGISSYRYGVLVFIYSFHLPLFLRVNVTSGEKEDRMMMMGLHTVADIFCVGCGSIIGWKYEFAHEKNQKYKEGKYVLERFKVSSPDGSDYWINNGRHVGGWVGGSDADDA
ncbi:protein yippee-like [Hibiscus syriacus]|uniref:protein yippee-like n=1 Tax=Hibiscus syriacus TaxID=106335 RepID=UPI0019247CF1|nr:protein yippee-like [Hibiscus syriacus]